MNAMIDFGEMLAGDVMSARHFSGLAALIQAETGIKMPLSKQSMLTGRLRRRLRETGHRTIDDYCAFVLGADVPREEIVHLINAVTTNKTDFFREPKHFDYLCETILPAYAAERRRSIRCWSAACSTGAEPYTLAMLLDEFCQQHGGPAYEIIATDIDTDILSKAVKGIFPRDMLAPVPPHLRQRYVLDSKDPSRAECRIAPALRRKVAFGHLNLMNSKYPIGEPVDLIFCRNVLIYFDKPVQEAVVSRLCEKLRPGGYLFLGHSESISGLDLPLTAVAGTVFRRK